MNATAKHGAAIAAAIMLWLGLGFSLGWYYTFTYYGRVGWPMPLMETCGALVLYYFTVLNVTTEAQAVHWMIVFPVAGLLWAITVRVMGHWLRLAEPPFAYVALAVALGAVPLVLVGPWMAWLAGAKYGAFDMNVLLRVALRRDHGMPGPWLSPMYLALAVTGLAIQGAAYGALYRTGPWRATAHIGISAIGFTLLCILLGIALRWPLGRWLA